VDFGTVLFLPLLGGYIFFTRFNGTRYRASAFPAQRLIFPSAAFGLVFLSVARGVQVIAEEAQRYPDSWERLAIRGLIPGSALAAIMVLVAVLWLFDREAAEDAKTDGGINPLQQLKWRGSLLFLVAAIGIAVSFSRSSETFFGAIASSLPHGTLVSICSAGIAAYISRITNWPFLGVLLRAVSVLMAISWIGAAIILYGADIEQCWSRFLYKNGHPLVSASGVPAIALIAACIASLLANSILHPLAAASYQNGSDRANLLKQLLHQSLIDEKLIEVTLESDKVYIGWVASQPPSIEAADGYFAMLPVRSGYRDKDTRQLVVTTRYEKVFREMIDEAEKARMPTPTFEDFQKTIPLSSVVSVGAFDPAAYERFNLSEVEVFDDADPPAIEDDDDKRWRRALQID
jgi:hypothetical protein